MLQGKLDKWDLIKEIGAGIASKVMLAQHNETGELVAVKILTNTFSQVHRKGFKNEFAILQELSHPNIIKLLSFYDQVPFEEGPTRKRKATALAIEYAPQGDLFRYLENHGRFSEKLARHFFSQLIEALDYLHEKGIAHRDVKPENLLLDKDFNIKLTDFGFAKVFDEKSGKVLLQTPLGTDAYMAPELYLNKGYDGRGVDVFAAGVVLFLMTVGHLPFGRADPRDSFYRFLFKGREDLFWKYHIQFMENKSKEVIISKELKMLICKMLAVDPEERLTITKIKESYWYNENLPTKDEIMREMLEKKISPMSAEMHIEESTQADKKMFIDDTTQAGTKITSPTKDNLKMDLE